MAFSFCWNEIVTDFLRCSSVISKISAGKVGEMRAGAFLPAKTVAAVLGAAAASAPVPDPIRDPVPAVCLPSYS